MRRISSVCVSATMARELILRSWKLAVGPEILAYLACASGPSAWGAQQFLERDGRRHGSGINSSRIAGIPKAAYWAPIFFSR
jgi:hypothetical protein